jgi:2-keto-3-deoxy-L-rhamnonate aldolase RhmA
MATTLARAGLDYLALDLDHSTLDRAETSAL